MLPYCTLGIWKLFKQLQNKKGENNCALLFIMPFINCKYVVELYNSCGSSDQTWKTNAEHNKSVVESLVIIEQKTQNHRCWFSCHY